MCVVKGAFISERDCAFGDLLVGLFVRFGFVVSFCFGEKVQYTNAKRLAYFYMVAELVWTLM